MVSRILLTKISNVCSTVRRLSAIITIRPSIHPSIYPSIYPGSCSDPKWAGSPSLIPIRACLIPKSAHRDLEILVLEALSSVCLFFFIIISRVWDSQPFVRSFFALSCLCGSRWSYQRFVSWGIKNLSFVPHWVRVLWELDCRPTCHRIFSIELDQLFLFCAEGRGKGSSWWTWIASHWIFGRWTAAVRSNLVIAGSGQTLPNFRGHIIGERYSIKLLALMLS